MGKATMPAARILRVVAVGSMGCKRNCGDTGRMLSVRAMLRVWRQPMHRPPFAGAGAICRRPNCSKRDLGLGPIEMRLMSAKISKSYLRTPRFALSFLAFHTLACSRVLRRRAQ
jgi:hypothetical protein